MLKVKLLEDTAKPPTVAHTGEDLAYDLYASETKIVEPDTHESIKTGVAVEFDFEAEPSIKIGFLIKERSSHAKLGISILGGVIDSGYRGEVIVFIRNNSKNQFVIKVGDKIGNLIPMIVLAKSVKVYSDLSPALRGEGGFGSTDEKEVGQAS